MSTVETHADPDGAERRRSRSGSESGYRHIVEQVARRPWAILPETLSVIVDLLSYRSRGFRLSQEEIEERIGDRREAFDARRAKTTGAGGAVAVLPLYGVIAPKASMVQGASSPSGTGLDAFAQMFRGALADPSVGSILIDVDSPGGQVDGVPELAAEIRDARGQKPIVAIANTCAASAAYWIASQADEVVVSPSGEVGSVGVYAAHQDLSGMLEQDGVKMTLISAGKFKVEGNPFEPLSEEARAAIQADVDSFYSMFVGDVAKGRGVKADDVRADYGEGRMVLAKAAVGAGMADRVAAFSDTVARLARGTSAPGRRAQLPDLEETDLDASETDAELLADQVGETEGPDAPARAALDPEAATRLLSQPGFRRAYGPDKEDS